MKKSNDVTDGLLSSLDSVSEVRSLRDCGGSTAGDGSCDPPTRSMGVGFCNFRSMQWNTDTPLSQPLLQEHHIRESSKVVREEEGLSSNRWS